MEHLQVDGLLKKKMINYSTCEFDEMDDVSMKKMMMAVASTNLIATAADDLMNEEKEESSSLRRC